MERLQNEFAAIGFYLSSHPLAAYEVSLKRLGVTRAADLPALLQRGTPGRIKLAGTVIDRMERTSAKGNRFAFVQCSDQSGAFELTVFSEVLSAKRNLLEAGQAVLISADGRLGRRQVKLMAQSVEKLEDAVANAAAGLRIVITRSRGAGGAAQVARRQARPRAGSPWSCRWRRMNRRSRSPCPAAIRSRAGCATSSAACRASPRWKRFDLAARLFEQPGAPQASEPAPGEVRPSWDSPLLAGAGAAGRHPARHLVVVLPGWRGLVYDGVHPQTALSKKGLAAYAQIRCCARSASTGRFMRHLHGRVRALRGADAGSLLFVVKAPALVCAA
jgi:hypothetical protein